MPVHVEEMTTEVTVFDGELPLTEAQIAVLARRVMQCLTEEQRKERRRSASTSLRRESAPPLQVGE